MNSTHLNQGDKHVMISGGSRGVGKSLVEAVLAAGYSVSAFSRKPTEFTDSLSGNSRFSFFPADMADADSLSRFVTAATKQFGIPYGLVNCAGVASAGVLAMTRPEEIDDLLATNLGGPLHLTRLVVRQMITRPDGGAIINISSIIGLRGYSGLAAYAATKGGLDAMTRALARELGPRGIRVNSIAPGYIETEMTHGLDEAQKGQIVRRTPLGRLGHPGDVVGPVLFLLSDAAAFISGQVLVVDGGLTA